MHHMPSARPWRVCLCVVVALPLVGACGRSKPARFYTLSPLYAAPASPEAFRAIQLGVSIDEFPEYLDRPQMVGRAGGSRLDIAEFDRWAEPLEGAFARTLCEDLRSRLGHENVALFPWRDSDRLTHRVSVEVVRLVGSVGGDVELVVRWSVAADGKAPVDIRRSVIKQTCDTADFDGLVAAMSAATAKLADEIAAVLSGSRP